MSKNKNKREKKGYLEFFIVILISALFGGVGAVILEIYDKDVKSIGNLLEDVIGQGAFWLICFLSVVGSLVNIYMVWAVRKRCRTWDGGVFPDPGCPPSKKAVGDSTAFFP